MTTENPGTKAGENPPTDPKGQGNEPGGSKGTLSDKEAELLKENMAFKKKLKALEDAQAAADDARLKEQGKFKELAEKSEARAKAAHDKLRNKAVELVAIRAGIVDPDAVKLADLSGVTLDDDGNVSGAAEAVEALKASKPYLFGAQAMTPQGQKPTTTPKPNGANSGGSPVTFGDWEQMPAKDRYEWAAKNPQAYEALCAARRAALSKR